MPNPPTRDSSKFVARHAEARIRTALTDTRIVAMSGHVVGIEVNANASVRPRDFQGLTRRQGAAGQRFAYGIILHDGDRIQQIAPRLFAMPVEMLWTTPGSG